MSFPLRTLIDPLGEQLFFVGFKLLEKRPGRHLLFWILVIDALHQLACLGVAWHDDCWTLSAVFQGTNCEVQA